MKKSIFVIPILFLTLSGQEKPAKPIAVVKDEQPSPEMKFELSKDSLTMIENRARVDYNHQFNKVEVKLDSIKINK